MTSTDTLLSVRARRLIRRLMEAADAYAFLGAAPPEDRAEIENDFKDAQVKLAEYIGRLERNEVAK